MEAALVSWRLKTTTFLSYSVRHAGEFHISRYALLVKHRGLVCVWRSCAVGNDLRAACDSLWWRGTRTLVCSKWMRMDNEALLSCTMLDIAPKPGP